MFKKKRAIKLLFYSNIERIKQENYLLFKKIITLNVLNFDVAF